jgi:hypothetical protein
LGAEPSPVDVLNDLPAPRWDTLARAVRRAVDQLTTAEVPVALRPYSHWHPEALRDASRARRAVALALVSDARFRAEVGEATADDDQRARALTLDPLALRKEVGGDQAVALLAVTGQWAALATLAAVLADERSAANRIASEGPAKRVGDGQDEVRALRRKLAQAERREAELRRQLQRAVAERDDAQAAVTRAQGEQRALLERHDRERAGHRERLARLRRRVGIAERRAAASETRRAEIVENLAALSERLRAPLSEPPVGPSLDDLGDAGADGDAVPLRVRPATPGRPCRLPIGVDPDSATAVAALLQIPGLRVFVDGYNVAREPRAVPDSGLAEQRTWLVRQVGAVVARFDIRPTVVFDGRADVEGAGPRARGVIVCFTADETADEMLVSLLDRLPADEPALVVSSDREIRDAVTIRDANSMSAGVFLEAL